MTKCFADNCCTKSGCGKQFFSIPRRQREPERRKIWLDRMGKTEEETFEYARLCELHFAPDQYIRNYKGLIRLKPNAVPTIFQPPPPKNEFIILKPIVVPTTFQPCPAKDDPCWKKWRRIAVKEPAFIECEPELKLYTSASSSYPGNVLQAEVKVEPEEPEEPQDIRGLSVDEENSTEVKEEPIFQEVKGEPNTDDPEASETPSNENPIIMAPSSGGFRVNKSSKSMKRKMTNRKKSDMQGVTQKNGENGKLLVRRILKCPSCNKVFVYPSKLRRHVLIHIGLAKKVYKCASCVRSFSYRSELIRHLETHDKGRLLCTYCNKSFPDQSTFKKHAVIHTGEKPFHCSCGKAFKNESLLRQHQVGQLEAQPCRCICCMKSFSLRCECKVHMIEHTRKKRKYTRRTPAT